MVISPAGRPAGFFYDPLEDDDHGQVVGGGGN